LAGQGLGRGVKPSSRRAVSAQAEPSVSVCTKKKPGPHFGGQAGVMANREMGSLWLALRNQRQLGTNLINAGISLCRDDSTDGTAPVRGLLAQSGKFQSSKECPGGLEPPTRPL